MELMNGVLTEMGKDVIFAKTAIAPCIESLVVPFVKKHTSEIAGADAVISLTCAGGTKMFSGLIREKPVLSPVDMEGSKMIHLNPVERDYYTDLVVNGNCVCCEHCVMAYTAGICPVTSCPLGEEAMYEPCDAAPMEGKDKRCVMDPDLDCAWVEIKKRGWDLEGLKGLKKIHEMDHRRVSDFGGKYASKPAPAWLRSTIGKVGAVLPAGMASKLAQYTF